jgi:uncharacterized protein DUF3313
VARGGRELHAANRNSEQPGYFESGRGATDSTQKNGSRKEFAGFLKDYSNLKPNPNLDGNALTFVNADEQKNLHKYIAMIVDPVQVYLTSDADESKLPEKARGVGARYFHSALVGAVPAPFR